MFSSAETKIYPARCVAASDEDIFFVLSKLRDSSHTCIVCRCDLTYLLETFCLFSVISSNISSFDGRLTRPVKIKRRVVKTNQDERRAKSLMTFLKTFIIGVRLFS